MKNAFLFLMILSFNAFAQTDYQKKVYEQLTSLLVRTQSCSGVLITPSHVLTAAHCVANASWVEPFGVRGHINVSSYEIFPNDVAILRLSQEVTQIPLSIFENVRLVTRLKESQFRMFVAAVYDSAIPSVTYCQDIDTSSHLLISTANCALYPGTSGGPLFSIFGNEYKPFRMKIFAVASAIITRYGVRTNESEFGGVGNLSPSMLEELERAGLKTN